MTLAVFVLQQCRLSCKNKQSPNWRNFIGNVYEIDTFNEKQKPV